MSALVVIAKECVPGRVKTRLHPPFSLEDASLIAAASLADTLGTTVQLPADRHILYFDGDASTTPHAGFELLPQPSGPLDERLAALFDLLDEPTLLIGMDTPQVTTRHLQWPTETDAVLGCAEDGGFWAIGMREPRGDLIRGVPMSRADSGALQLAALHRAGLTVAVLDTLRDVDVAEDARVVAKYVPGSAFASAVARASTGPVPDAWELCAPGDERPPAVARRRQTQLPRAPRGEHG